MLDFLALVLGLLFGSFFNVCIYRIPRQESIAFPASHCPHCQQPIKPWDNIPVLSYLLLGGKCRACRVPIAWRYPAVEALTAGIFVVLLHTYGISYELLWYLILLCALLVISFIDFDHRIIPDVISLPGIVLGLSASYFLPITWFEAVLGAVVGGGLIFAVGSVGGWVFKKEAMGGGDVKLMAMIGAFLGWKLALLTIFFASLVGAVIGIIQKIKTGQEYIPFGPFLSLGAVFALFVGNPLIRWYVGLLFPHP